MIPQLILRQHREVKIVAVIVSALFILHLLVVTFLSKSPYYLPANYTLTIIETSSATIILYLAGRASQVISRKAYLTWTLLALGELFNTLGIILTFILKAGVGSLPEISPVQLLYLIAYLFFISALFFIPARKPGYGGPLKLILDMAAVLIALWLPFWNFIIAPLAASRPQTFLNQAATIVYPMADLTLILGFLFLQQRIPQWRLRVPYYFLIAGLVGLIIADAFAFFPHFDMNIQEVIINLGYIITHILLALAGMTQLFMGQRVKEEGKTPEYESTGIWWSSYLPFLVLILAYLMTLWSQFHPLAMSHETLMLWCGVVIILVIFRQAVTLWENHRLDNDLYAAIHQVQKQADHMEQINKDLNIEISERLRVEEKLAYDNLHDPLTGLPNRVFFTNQLERNLERTRRHENFNFAVFMLDLDQFKLINDSLGHNMGDRLLIEIAYRFQQSLRASDMVARFGGDEFMFLIDDIKISEVNAIAGRILNLLEIPFRLDEQEFVPSASMGIVINDRYESPMDILRDADIAMYTAKTQGKGRYLVFDLKMRSLAVERVELEHDLRQAVEELDFQLYYQPIVTLQNGSIRVKSFEALLRWPHPEKGLRSPGEFIPLAEETGLIIPMGYWVIEQACTQLNQWRQQYPHIPTPMVTVNVSSKQFMDKSFVKQVEHILQECNFGGLNLGIEITESLLLETSRAPVILEQLKDLGIRLLIDDFGTGYSALSYLHRFPIQTIKIDRSFISHIETNEDNQKIVRSILSLADEMGMDVVAEGVETAREMEKLVEYNCPFAQGFLFSKPVDSTAAGDWLAEHFQNGFAVP